MNCAALCAGFNHSVKAATPTKIPAKANNATPAVMKAAAKTLVAKKTVVPPTNPPASQPSGEKQIQLPRPPRKLPNRRARTETPSAL